MRDGAIKKKRGIKIDVKTEVTVSERMQTRFLNANWQYFKDAKSTPEAVKIAKAVFLLIGAGRMAEARALARTDEKISDVWNMALQ